MTNIRLRVEAEEVRQAAKYTLFVEGSSDFTIDPQTLGILLQDTLS